MLIASCTEEEHLLILDIMLKRQEDLDLIIKFLITNVVKARLSKAGSITIVGIMRNLLAILHREQIASSLRHCPWATGDVFVYFLATGF